MKMNKRRKLLTASLFVVGIFAILAGVVGIAQNYYTKAPDKEKKIYQAAGKEKKRLEKAGEYNPEEISESQIEEKAKNVAEMFDMSEEEAKDKIRQDSMNKKALYLAAKEAKIVVSSEEVAEQIEKARKVYHEDEEGKKELQALIAGMGMTEDEYWEAIKPQYESNMRINKYLQEMYKKKCQEEDISYPSPEFTEKQEVWREELTKAAIEKYHVTIDG